MYPVGTVDLYFLFDKIVGWGLSGAQKSKNAVLTALIPMDGVMMRIITNIRYLLLIALFGGMVPMYVSDTEGATIAEHAGSG